MQQQFALLTPSKLIECGANQKVRIAWVKSRLGWINHAYTTPKPLLKKINVVVFISNVFGNESIPLEIFRSYRVRQVMDLLSRRLNYHLEDYTLAANINGRIHLLFDDEILGDLVDPPKEEGGFFGFFKSEDYPINLFLRKAWSLEYQLECKQDDGKLILEVEEIIYRLFNDEIKLAMEESIAVYSFYYAFRHFIELDTLTLSKLKMKNEEFTRFVAPYLKNNLFF